MMLIVHLIIEEQDILKVCILKLHQQVLNIQILHFFLEQELKLHLVIVLLYGIKFLIHLNQI